MVGFRYDAPITERFPTIVGGLIHAEDVSNGPTAPGLAEALRAEATAVLARIGETPLSELPTLAAWRRVFRGFGVDPTQYRSAAEALLRRLTNQGEAPGARPADPRAADRAARTPGPRPRALAHPGQHLRAR